jgi:four helix bundle protein
MNYKRYTELEVWEEATSLACEIYKLTLAYPKSELFGIVSQLRRCAVSIPSNIAEGCGKQYNKESIQFLSIARGSLYELETQLYISKELNFITADQLELLLSKIQSQGKLINGFIRYYKTKI